MNAAFKEIATTVIAAALVGASSTGLLLWRQIAVFDERLAGIQKDIGAVSKVLDDHETRIRDSEGRDNTFAIQYAHIEDQVRDALALAAGAQRQALEGPPVLGPDAGPAVPGRSKHTK